MRFFEFKLPQPGSDLEREINASLEKIENAVEENPDLEKKVSQELAKIINFAKSLSVDDAKEKEDQVKETSSDNQIANQVKQLKSLVDLIPNADDQKKAQQQIEALEALVQKETHPDTVFGKIGDEFKAILEQRRDISPAVREVFIKELFDYIRVNKQTDLVKQFLNDCVSGNGPIDMPNIVKTEGPGNLVEKSSPYFNILLKLAKTNPGSGNAASGQGEYMLVLAGKDTKKINPGDIGVGKEKIEVKSSDVKGKSSYTDFVLSSDKLPVAQAKSYFVSEINKILGRQEIGSGTATSGGISALNDKTIRRLNPIFQEVNSKKPGAMQEIIKGLWKTVYPDDQLNSYVNAVANAVNSDGTLELSKLYGPTAVLSAAAYKLSNMHDALLMLNIPDLSYIVVRDPDEMSKIFKEGAVELGMTSIFDFRSNPGAPTFIKKFSQANKS